jgi:uncharacterized protein YdhG (YjbR/CyaY superfamily)/predicted RNase H-like HicB family nuclease
MAKPKFETVDDYLAAQPDSIREILQTVRGAIRKALPQADEAISYQIPAYKVGGRVVVYFAGWREHFSLYPVTEPVRTRFKSELARYEVSKGTVRFPLSEPVPARLIARIAKALAESHAASMRGSSSKARRANASLPPQPYAERIGRRKVSSHAGKRRQAMRFKVTLQKSHEGFAVSVPGLPGCWSQGLTEAEALSSIKEAISEYLAARDELLRGADVREVEILA